MPDFVEDGEFLSSPPGDDHFRDEADRTYF